MDVMSYIKEALASRAIPKAHQTKRSGTARKSVWQPTSILQPTSQANACRAITKVLELLGQLYPARLLFFRRLFASSLLTKSKSPHAVGTGVANASEATHDALGPNALKKMRGQAQGPVPTGDGPARLPTADSHIGTRIEGRLLFPLRS